MPRLVAIACAVVAAACRDPSPPPSPALAPPSHGARGVRYADDYAGGTTGGIQEAIDSLGGQPGSIVLGPHGYHVTTPIAITHHRQHLVGAGKWATEIDFEPTAPGALFTFSSGRDVHYQSSIGGLAISGAGPQAKVGIRVLDASELDIHDVAVLNWHSEPAPSVAIELRGRELLTLARASLNADRPIVLDANPSSTIEADAYAFRDLYLQPAPTEACIRIDGVARDTVIHHWRMDGIDCVGGQYGVYLSDRVGVASFLDWDLRNLHWEQQGGHGGYFLYLDRAQGTVQNLTLTNVDAGAGDHESNGFWLRNTLKVTAANLMYQGTRGIALDADASNRGLVLVNPSFQIGSRVRDTSTGGGPPLVWTAYVHDPPSSQVGFGALVLDQPITITRIRASTASAPVTGCAGHAWWFVQTTETSPPSPIADATVATDSGPIALAVPAGQPARLGFHGGEGCAVPGQWNVTVEYRAP